MKIAMKLVYSNPEVIKRMSESAKNKPADTDITKQKKSNATKTLWKNKEYRELMNKTRNSPKANLANKQRNIDLWKNEEYKLKMKEKRNTPEYKEMMKFSREFSKKLVIYKGKEYLDKDLKKELKLSYKEISLIVKVQ